MRKIVIFTGLLLLFSCQQQLPTNQEGLQKIFDTKDFTVTFTVNGEEHFMGFRQDYVTYKHEGNTVRETITYDQALLVNNFIRQQLKAHSENATMDRILVESPQYSVELKTDGFAQEFDHMMDKLNFK